MLVSVGTEHQWAPPRLVEFGLSDDLDIVNVEPVRWETSAAGTVSRVAVCQKGQWYLVEGERHDFGRFAAGQAIALDVGAIRFSIILNNPVGMDASWWLGGGDVASPEVRPRLRGLQRWLTP